jgi:tetratricopeptide (TPR) repeat protein
MLENIFDFKPHNRDIVGLRWLSANQVAEMTHFEVKDKTITQETQDKFFQNFDQNSKFFLAHQGDLLAFDALVKMGLIKQFVGDYKGAEQIFLYTYALEPNSTVLNGNIAHLYLYYLQDYKKAEEFYLKAVASAKGGNLYTYYTEMYDLYHDGLKDPQKTQDLLKKATTVIPDSSTLQQLAGRYFASIGDKAKARAYYEQALKLDPNDQATVRALENL